MTQNGLVRQSGDMQSMPLDDIIRVAKGIVDSKMFGIQTEAQAVTLMLLCQAEGIHPILAVRRYHIVQGRPTMRADAMQAEFQNRGGEIEFHERNDKVCDATFTAGRTVARVIWTMEKAKQAGLLSKGGNWNTYPTAMLHARCVSEGVRAVMPAVVAGIYTPEEVEQFETKPQSAAGKQEIGNHPRLNGKTEPKNVTPAQEAVPMLPEDADNVRRLSRAKLDFITSARSFNMVINTDDRPLRDNMAMLLKDVLQMIPDYNKPEHWEGGTIRMQDYVDSGEALLDGWLVPADAQSEVPAPELGEPKDYAALLKYIDSFAASALSYGLVAANEKGGVSKKGLAILLEDVIEKKPDLKSTKDWKTGCVMLYGYAQAIKTQNATEAPSLPHTETETPAQAEMLIEADSTTKTEQPN